MLTACKTACSRCPQDQTFSQKVFPCQFAIKPLVGAIALLSSSWTFADDIACAVTVSNAGLADSRSFPTVSGETVLRGRTDGNPATCTIIPNITPATVNYPSGLTLLPDGTNIDFRNIDININNGMTVDNNNAGTGVINISSEVSTRLSGDVQLLNTANLNFITANSGSSTTRLHLKDAYIHIDDTSQLGVEFTLGDTTGEYISIGSLSGSGDIYLTNTGSASNYGTIFLNHNNGQDYSYSGDIYYSDQMAPTLSKSGSGIFTFTGDVKKSSGDTVGFTDGFGVIEVNGGALKTTTKAFIYGTRVELNGGDLILDQDFDGSTLGGQLTGGYAGSGSVIKRGNSIVSLANIGQSFQGNILVEEGTLAFSSSSSLPISNSIHINNGAILDISNAYSGFDLTRVYGDGVLIIGNKNTDSLIRINPGDQAGGIGKFTVAGSGSFSINGSLLELDIDAGQSAGNDPGISHDQLAVGGNVRFSTAPVLKLFDREQGSNPSSLVSGREFTLVTAGSGLSDLKPDNILLDTQSFHAFVGADAEKTTISDTEVKVVFGIKSVNQVVNTIQQVLLTPATVIQQPQPPVTTPPDTPDVPPPTVTPPNAPDNMVTPVQTGSANNAGNAAAQYIQQTTGLTGNQTPTLEQIETHPTLASVTTEGLIIATSNNNPEAYSSHLTIGLEYQDLVGNMVMNHTSGSGLGLQDYQTKAQTDDRYWLDIVYVDGQVDGKAGYTGNFDYKLTSLVTGVDLWKNNANNLGVFASIGSSQLDEHDHIIQDIETDALNVGGYHQFQFSSGYKLHSTLMGFYHNSDSKRGNLDTNGSLAGQSNSDFSSYGASLGMMLNKDFALSESITISPDIDLNYSYLKQQAIDEYNGGLAYDYFINATDAQSLVLGLGADTSFKLSQNKPIYLDLRARYEFDAYANNNDTHDIDAGLSGQSTLTYIGQNRGEHGVILGVGVGGEIAKNATLSGGYWYSHRSNGRESSLGASFTYFW